MITENSVQSSVFQLRKAKARAGRDKVNPIKATNISYMEMQYMLLIRQLHLQYFRSLVDYFQWCNLEKLFWNGF